MSRTFMQHIAGMWALALVVTVASALPLQPDKKDAGPKEAAWTALPWYITSAAIHRVTLKPNNRFWRFEHLSLKAPEAASQLNARSEEHTSELQSLRHLVCR